MTPDDIARLINEENPKFEIESYYTDKHISDDYDNGWGIQELIEYAKRPGISTMYLDGDSFVKYSTPPQLPPEGEGLEDRDEFTQDHDVGGVLVFYTGVAGEMDLVAAMAEKFKQYQDDWLEILRWH